MTARLQRPPSPHDRSRLAKNIRSMRGKPKILLRARIMMVVVLASASAIIISIIGFSDQRALAEAYARAALRSAADTIADSYGEQLLAVGSKLTLITRSDGQLKNANDCNRSLRDLVLGSPLVTSASLVNTRNQVLCSFDKTRSGAIVTISRSLVHRALSKPSSTISELGNRPARGQPALFLVRGIKDEDLAVFAVIDLHALEDLLPEPKRGSVTALLDSAGHPIMVKKAALPPFVIPRDFHNITKIITSNGDRRAEDVLFGHAIIAYKRAIDRLGYAVTASSLAVLYAPAVATFSRNIALSTVFILLTALLAWRTLVIPLVRRANILRTTAEALAGGDLAVRTGAPNDGDELTDVGRAFDQMAEALSKHDRALKTLGAGNSAVVRAPTESWLLQEMCEVIVDSGNYSMAWIGYARSDPAKTIRPMACAGKQAFDLRNIHFSWAETDMGLGPEGRCIRNGTPQVAHDITNDHTLKPWRALLERQGYRSILALPLMTPSSPSGALVLYASEKNAFDAQSMDFLTRMARDLSYGISVLRARRVQKQNARRLERSLTETVQALAQTVEFRDPYTAGHQRRVSKIALAIAREMALDRNRIKGLTLAASIHDIGKLAIPADILSKPGKLSDLEMILVREHSEAGYRILQGIDFPWPVADIVRQHHERLNGSGYPRGLKSEEMLQEAKIIAVADVVESMLSYRPYRDSLGLDEALYEIVKGRGVLYDANTVDACVKLFQEQGFSLELD